MAKRHRNLIQQITTDASLRLAYARTARGRRLTYGALEFKDHAEVNLAKLGRELADGSYRPDPVHQFVIYEPKAREITALSFRDRVAQHALVGVIGPILEATLLPRTYACRKGMGTHAGVAALQAEMRRSAGPLYFLKTDFRRYFASIDRAILHRLIRAKITCRATLAIIDAITPASGLGLPIGSLTSQLYANLYGGVVDRFLHFELGERRWHRYMDDIVALGDSLAHLRDVRRRLGAFAMDRLHLHFSKWSVAPVARGVNFLGYRIWPTHKLLRHDSVIRARRAIAAMRAGGRVEDLRAFLAAWSGHAGHADVHNLFATLGLETGHADQHAC